MNSPQALWRLWQGWMPLCADYRIGAGELAISDVEVIFAAQKHENEQCHNGKREKICFGLWLHGVFRGGAKRVLMLALDVFLSMFSQLIYYCATRVALWLGFFLRKQKPPLWAVRTRNLMRRAGLEGADY